MFEKSCGTRLPGFKSVLCKFPVFKIFRYALKGTILLFISNFIVVYICVLATYMVTGF